MERKLREVGGRMARALATPSCLPFTFSRNSRTFVSSENSTALNKPVGSRIRQKGAMMVPFSNLSNTTTGMEEKGQYIGNITIAIVSWLDVL